jgi:hypothetical protein
VEPKQILECEVSRVKKENKKHFKSFKGLWFFLRLQKHWNLKKGSCVL